MGIPTTEDYGWMQARVFVYQMAHAVFSGEPDASLFEVLSSEGCVSTLDSMADGTSDGSFRALASYCRELAEANSRRRDELLQRCSSSYSRYIMGLGAQCVSRPWESFYTSSKKLLFQTETLEVRDFYRSFGYLPKMYRKVADDHLSLECAFMAALAQESLGAEGDRLQELLHGQRDFLQKHLIRWVGRYADALAGEAAGSLYALQAQALAAFAQGDAQFFCSLCDE